MRAFLVGHLCDKMSDVLSGLIDVLIVIEVNFFLFERADETFSISVFPRPSAPCDRDLNAMLMLKCGIAFQLRSVQLGHLRRFSRVSIRSMFAPPSVKALNRLTDILHIGSCIREQINYPVHIAPLFKIRG